MKGKPVIAVTMGDPAGIGPEIVLKAFSAGQLNSYGQLVLIGDARVLHQAMDFCGLSLDLEEVTEIPPAQPRPGAVSLVDMRNISPSDYRLGQVGRESGRASVEYLLKAIELVGEGRLHALVTAPICKEAINSAGYAYPGHTEILAERTGTREYSTMMVVERLRVVHLSWHVSLKQACALVNKERVAQAIRMALLGARELGLTSPRIAVAGLNPHAGEAGLIGAEEEEEIAPAIAQAALQGVKIWGPLSPDTVFLRASRGEFDLVVAMYHDQGHIPAKLIGFEQGVNVTLGLPILRTSVVHGTAFDLAGQGRADPSSLINAIKLAGEIINRRRLQPS
ncbi:MAG: 4-hydroxythreonine-4-phosphate dehydrogenase PdxA [Thermodesulfobacteriota bacterium]